MKKNIILQLFFVIVFYYLFLLVSYKIVLFSKENIAIFWPVSGFVVALLILSPKISWIYLLFIIFIFNFYFKMMSLNNFLLALSYSSINIIEPLIIVSLIKKKYKNFSFTNQHQLIFFLIATILTSSISAFLSITIKVLDGFKPFSFFLSWQNWTMSVSLGILITTPLIIWLIYTFNNFNNFLKNKSKHKANYKKNISYSYLFKYIALLSLIISITSFIFIFFSQYASLLIYITFPLIILTTLQYEIRGTCTILFIFSLTVILYTSKGYYISPTLSINTYQKILWIQSYLITTTITALILTVIFNEQKYLVKKLKESKLQAENANKAKSLFLANMSHEIRTPLSGILGMTEMAIDQETDPLKQNNLQQIKKSTNSLLTIINDILDFSKIEANKISLQYINFDLHKEIENIMSIFSLKAKEKNLQLVLNIKPGAKRYICSDIVRIKQILINLIDNAIKFSHNGKIIVFLQSKKRKKHNILHFSVSDSGIGIAAKDTKKLFNLFYQIDCSYSKKYEGTGLGLCISKKLVKLLGGKIWVKSIVNKGSTFHFILPIKKTNLSYNKKIELPKNISIKKSLKILLADDNKVNQRFISYFLKKAGHKVHIANNGEEVLNKINNENYELILMDIQMPIIDGLKTTQIIRNNMKKNLSQISIIALTAYARKEEKEKFKKAGFNSHVTKPVNIEKLINTIEEIDKIKFSKSSNFSSSDSHTDSYTDTEINKNNDTLPYTSANKKIILNKLGNDEKLFDYVFYPFTNEIPNKINLLQKNIQQFNYDEINRIAHSLKGSSGTIGADLCSYLSNKIEIAAKKHDMKNIKNIYSHLEKELKHIQNL